jgi:hypothetical protein
VYTRVGELFSSAASSVGMGGVHDVDTVNYTAYLESKAEHQVRAAARKVCRVLVTGPMEVCARLCMCVCACACACVCACACACMGRTKEERWTDPPPPPPHANTLSGTHTACSG